MPFREKLDSTSAYIKNMPTSGGPLVAWVQRSNVYYPQRTDYNVNDSYNPASVIDRWYAPYTDRITYFGPADGRVLTVNEGYSRYLPNYVYEDGYTYASVAFFPEIPYAEYNIRWSPDSV